MSVDNTLDKVKKLREITGVGFKDCKSAIDEPKGDIEMSFEEQEKYNFVLGRDYPKPIVDLRDTRR